MLEKEFEYYQKNKENLSKEYLGKFIVIINTTVEGVYDSEKEAYNETIKNHPVGTFLIQQCLSGHEMPTQTFHSRVIF